MSSIIDQAIAHLSETDPILGRLIKNLKEIDQLPKPRNPSNGFVSLVRTVIGQQLSVKAAKTIYMRFESGLYGQVTPNRVNQLSAEDMRAFGISSSKSKCILRIAEAIEGGDLSLAQLQTCSFEEAAAELMKIKGIGKWTADMYCIGQLQHPDVFPSSDGGIRKAMKLAYGQWEGKSDDDAISMRWRPYRTYASRVLWRALDNGLLD